MITHARLCHIRELFSTNAGNGIFGITPAEMNEILDIHIAATKPDEPTEALEAEPEAQSQEETEARQPEPKRSAREEKHSRAKGR